MVFCRKYSSEYELFSGKIYSLLKVILVYIFCIFVYACQSDKILIDVKDLDSRLSSSFSSCSTGGGTNDTQVYRTGKLYGSFDIEWLVGSSGWKTVVTSSIGQDLMSIDYNKKLNKIFISEVVSFPYDIKVGQGGFIYVEDKMIPVKVSEIPCFLNHHYPSSWLKSASVYKRDNSYFITKKESQRKIEIEMLVKKNTSKKSVGAKETKKEDKVYACATVSWDAFLWFDASAKICMEDNKSSMVDVQKYMVKLTAIE